MIYPYAPTITVIGEDEPIEIGFEAVAAYHGQAALAMLAVTFRALDVALKMLSSEQSVRRNDISVVSGHPGPGVRDSFEFVTRAVTRGAYTVDRNRPKARLMPGIDISYSFDVTVRGKTAEIALLRDALPKRFFELTFNPSRSAADDVELRLLKKDIAARTLLASAETLFDLRVVER